jgi:hypothetical protein
LSENVAGEGIPVFLLFLFFSRRRADEVWDMFEAQTGTANLAPQCQLRA